MRALTHTRVDDRAGIPRGSTSNYFRTRAALLTGISDWIVERELREVGPAFAPASADELVDALGALIEYLTGPNRTMTAARLALFMEASHDPGLRKSVAHGREVMESAVVAAFSRFGARAPEAAAAAVMACGVGWILHRIVRHDETDPRPSLRVVVRGAVG